MFWGLYAASKLLGASIPNESLEQLQPNSFDTAFSDCLLTYVMENDQASVSDRFVELLKNRPLKRKLEVLSAVLAFAGNPDNPVRADDHTQAGSGFPPKQHLSRGADLLGSYGRLVLGLCTNREATRLAMIREIRIREWADRWRV